MLEGLDKYYRKHILSKSTFVQGKQCKKMIYLNKYKREERKKYSKQTEVLFTFGKEFEQAFRTKFSDSFHLEEAVENKFHLYAGYTEKLLKEKTHTTLFEAGVIYDEVLVLTDVLQMNEDDSYTIYEVKYTNKLKPVVIWDLSLQYYICKKKLGNIESFNVVLKGQKGKFKITDLTKMLERNFEQIEQEIKEFKKILKQESAPEVEIGSQCFRPYECVFFDYCRK
tara:strand:+ start:2548 stop:3222 length:675 start_codon:yes stop_codon:yes gene_type:complete